MIRIITDSAADFEPKELEQPGKQQHHQAGFTHIQEHDPPGPLIAEGALKICKTRIAAAAGADIRMVDQLGQSDRRVPTGNQISGNSRRKPKQQFHEYAPFR